MDPAEAGRQAKVFLVVQQLDLRPFDGVADPLPGDAAVGGNLRQGKVLVVIEFHHVPLLLGEHIPVKVQKQRDLQVLCHQCIPLPAVKAVSLHTDNTLILYRYKPLLSRGFSLHREDSTKKVFFGLFSAVSNPPALRKICRPDGCGGCWYGFSSFPSQQQSKGGQKILMGDCGGVEAEQTVHPLGHRPGGEGTVQGADADGPAQ